MVVNFSYSFLIAKLFLCVYIACYLKMPCWCQLKGNNVVILIDIDTELLLFVCCFSFLISSSASWLGKQTFILVAVKVLQRRFACLTRLTSKSVSIDNGSDFLLFCSVLKWKILRGAL